MKSWDDSTDFEYEQSVNSFTSAEVNGLQRGCSVITYFCRRDLDEESGQYVSPFFSLFFFMAQRENLNDQI